MAKINTNQTTKKRPRRKTTKGPQHKPNNQKRPRRKTTKQMSRRIVRYWIKSGPNLKIDRSRSHELQLIIQNGFEMWTQANPHLVFVYSKRGPLLVKLTTHNFDIAGTGTIGTFPRGIITVDVNKADARAVAHEFGHVVGYGHHKEGLMRPVPWVDFKFSSHHDSDDRDYYQSLVEVSDDDLIPDMRKARRFNLPVE